LKIEVLNIKEENLLILKKIFQIVLDLDDEIDIENVRKIDTHSWDSLAIVSFQSAIQSEMGIELDLQEFFEITSFKMLKLLLASKGY
jgi:acyl carrier protein